MQNAYDKMAAALRRLMDEAHPHPDCDEQELEDFAAAKDAAREVLASYDAEQTRAPFDVYVVWGDNPEPGTRPTGYPFATVAERDAFMLGVTEAGGWLDAEFTDGPDYRVNKDGEIVPIRKRTRAADTAPPAVAPQAALGPEGPEVIRLRVTADLALPDLGEWIEAVKERVTTSLGLAHARGDVFPATILEAVRIEERRAGQGGQGASVEASLDPASHDLRELGDSLLGELVAHPARMPTDFDSAVRLLERPYFRISEEQQLAIAAKAAGNDVLLFRGRPVTWGTADGGFALMPLSSGGAAQLGIAY